MDPIIVAEPEPVVTMEEIDDLRLSEEEVEQLRRGEDPGGILAQRRRMVEARLVRWWAQGCKPYARAPRPPEDP